MGSSNRTNLPTSNLNEPQQRRTVKHGSRRRNMIKTPKAANKQSEPIGRIPADNELTPEQRKLTDVPKVGIFFVHDHYPWIDCTPITEAIPYADVLTHDKGHDTYCEELQASGSVPKDEEYIECQRGRVCYDPKTGPFTFFLTGASARTKT